MNRNMKETKRKTALLIAISTMLALTFMVNQAHADIQQWIWCDYVYKGYDSYYGANIVAYLNGTTVKLKLPVINDVAGSSINITVISLVFDNGYNVTITPNVNVVRREVYYFDIHFTADVNDLPNFWAHTYTIYVYYQDSLGTNYWTRDWNYYSPSYKFVVYTSDQKDVRDLSVRYSAYSSYSPQFFEIVGARLLAAQANVEASIAQNLANLGNFAEAKAHYQAAVNLYEQAFNIEGEKGAAKQDADVNAIEKQADAALKEADASMLQAQAIMNQSYGYILFGLGFILIGIGAIIYAAKKPKTS